MTLWIAFTYIITTVIVGLISPFWGLIGLIGSQLIRFQDRFELINSIPTFLIMSLAVFLGFMINRHKLGTAFYWPDKYFKRFLAWACLGLLIMEFSNFIEPVKLILSSMLMYYMATRAFTSESRFIILFFFLTLITVFMGYEASTAYLTEEVTNFAYAPSPDERRLQGLGRYANPNEFGMLMVIPLTFLFPLIMLSKSFVMRLIYLATMVFLLFVTALTLSRTCMMLAAIMGLTIAGLWGNGNLIKKALVLGILGLILLYILTLIPGPIQERILSILNYEEDASFQGRVRAWKQGYFMIKSYPIFGVGMGQWNQYHGLEAHNTFVQVMAETGLPGIFLYLSAIFYSFKTCLGLIAIPQSDARYNRSARIIAISLTSTLFGYCVYIFFGNQAYTPLIYLYCGLCASVANLTALKEEDMKKASAPMKQKNKKQRVWAQQTLAADHRLEEQLAFNENKADLGESESKSESEINKQIKNQDSPGRGLQISTQNNELNKNSKKRFPQAPD